jgi:hypothetical protein
MKRDRLGDAVVAISVALWVAALLLPAYTRLDESGQLQSDSGWTVLGLGWLGLLFAVEDVLHWLGLTAGGGGLFGVPGESLAWYANIPLAWSLYLILAGGRPRLWLAAASLALAATAFGPLAADLYNDHGTGDDAQLGIGGKLWVASFVPALLFGLYRWSLETYRWWRARAA